MAHEYLQGEGRELGGVAELSLTELRTTVEGIGVGYQSTKHSLHDIYADLKQMKVMTSFDITICAIVKL